MNLPQLPQDKANHLVYGLAIYLVTTLLLGPAVGLAVCATAAALKEAYDSTGRGHVEFADFAATVAGGLTGLACTALAYI